VKQIAVLDDYQGAARSFGPWEDLAGSAQVTYFDRHFAKPDDVVKALAPFEIVVAMRERTRFSREVLEQLGRLELLVTTGMGNAAIDMAAAAELGIVVAGTASVGPPTAELTWGLILGLARHIGEEDQALRAGAWQTTIGTDLAGATLGLVGFGRLGQRVAAVARAFEMNVVAWSTNLDPSVAEAAGVTPVEKSELFATSDIVSIHLVLSDRSRGIVGREEIEAMKPTALLVNTSRGPVVDKDALVAALHAGSIAGAALDVFDVEPLPEGDPLRKTPHTLLTPHLGYVTSDTYRVFYGEAVEDIVSYLAGSPVRVLQ